MIKDYIKIPDLKDRYLYKIHARNAIMGIWIKEHSSFLIVREKFGAKYLFEEFHYDTGAPFGTVFPFEEIEQYPKEINSYYDDEEVFKYLDKE